MLQSGRGGRTKVTARVTARTDSGMRARGANTGGTLNPPMSSVVVERHPPINKVQGEKTKLWSVV